MPAPDPVKVRYARAGDAVVLALQGRVHYAFGSRLRAFFDELSERLRGAKLFVDLRSVEAIDSTGMGLLARLGLAARERGRGAVIVCSNDDVCLCLHSAAFGELFEFSERWPFDETLVLGEVPLGASGVTEEQLGPVMLEAHRDLAALSDQNRRTFADVIAALESACKAPNPAH
ncbi:MAG TPA: STAS domain-containing protein [Polyangiaceae bacterium]